ncbi:ThuA domain-containing protein [Jatrophihabitans fulvus]
MRVLAVTGGHRVDLDAFRALLAAVCAEHDWVFAHAVQPDAQQWLTPAHRGAFDAILCHDIPGLTLRRGTAPTPVGPSPRVAADLAALLDAGQGMVFLHHALAGWPGWEGWAEVLGGRYHYAPGRLRGEAWPDSGYRHTHYTVTPETHPVTDGVEPFELDDELYRCPVFEADVVPLLRASAAGPGEFRQTYHEVLGTAERPAWTHPPASDLVGWAKPAGRSPVVYLQPGDGPDTFGHPAFRRVLGNALTWVASDAAHAWAAENRTTIATPREEDD